MSFGASNPASFSFGNLLFGLTEEVPERSTNTILTNVTHAGNGEGSQVSQAPCYLDSQRWPWTGSQGWCQRAARTRLLKRNWFSVEAAVVGNRFLGMSHHPMMVALVGIASCWQRQHILLSAPLTVPTLFS